MDQLSGCAMVTLAACIYAIIYHAYHNMKALLTRYKNNILFFKENLPFGILEGEAEKRTMGVNLIDPEISINKHFKIKLEHTRRQ